MAHIPSFGHFMIKDRESSVECRGGVKGSVKAFRLDSKANPLDPGDSETAALLSKAGLHFLCSSLCVSFWLEELLDRQVVVPELTVAATQHLIPLGFLLWA